MEPTQELDYYKMRLRRYLHSGFPELLGNDVFIQERSDSAAEAYEEAFRAGNPVEVCNEEAKNVLFEGLHFSRFSTIFEVLISDFEQDLKDEQFRPVAIQLLPVCGPVFAKYELDDDFAYSPEYDLLYAELTGLIANWMGHKEDAGKK